MISGGLRGLFAVLIFGAPLVAGCDRVASYFDLTGTVAGTAPQLIGDARLRVSLPETGAVAVLGPVSRSGDVTVWQTLDGITLSFRQGVLVATRGLADDLMSADVTGDLTLLHGRGEGGYQPHVRSYLDGEDRTVFRAYQCLRAGARPARAGPGGQTTRLRRVEISCTSPGHEFTNVFLLDGAGRVVESRQWISPKLQYMDTERLAR